MPIVRAVLAKSERSVWDIMARLAASATTDHWQVKVLGAVYVAASLPIMAHLVTHPALLRRRMKALVGERDPVQRLIVALSLLCVGAEIIVAMADLRSGWSAMPMPVVVFGDLLVAAALVLVWLVFRANQYAAATVQVEHDQPVISSGPYAFVRHPMYSGGLLLIPGIALALASWWALAFFIPLAALIVWRLTTEEAFLLTHLPGYGAYRAKVVYRLVPGVW
jgi:protein-S-isoprenylcysteine O-methyltransferase Ste14